MSNITLKTNPDNHTIIFDNNKMTLKLSSKVHNGLSFSGSNLVATKAPDGESGSVGTMNTPGNGIGPTDATSTTALTKVGLNSTVSRHEKYSGNDTFIQDNDGPVMTKVLNGSLVPNQSIASYMISYST